MSDRRLTTPSSSKAIDQFIEQASKTPVASDQAGRLIFALDATASRQPTWDTACQLQSELFLATQSLGGLSIQLCYYRGYKEFHASPWVGNTDRLLHEMNRVTCLGGQTQIGRVLTQAIKETRSKPVKAVILVVDCCEEAADDLCQLAGELGMLKTPVFVFHEGNDARAKGVFQQIAQLSAGAYTPFDPNSPAILKKLLAAVAVFATGGKKALDDFAKTQSREVKQLTQQLKQ